MLPAVLSGFALAIIAPWVYRRIGKPAAWLFTLLPAGLTVYFVRLAGPVLSGDTIVQRLPWAPSLDIYLSFRADALSLLFALIITGIGTFVLLYSAGYMTGGQLGRFYAFLLMFMASMLGVVLADNVIVLFVFWELTSLSSYLLIGFDHAREEARSAALQALLVTGIGGLALLAGFLLLGQAGDSLELSRLSEQGDLLRTHSLYGPMLLLILAGAFTKSAQFPFHFWLPNAMEAPTPVSAYLHAATMVKAGVYLIARVSPMLGATAVWTYAVGSVGAATMALGAALALQETAFKRILAYTTVSALGMFVFLLGLGESAAVGACMVAILAHAFYKGALFMMAGIVQHQTGEHDVERTGGLRRNMPVSFAAALLAAFSMAGVPPLAGFIGKDLVLDAVWHSALHAGPLTVITLAVAAGTVAAALIAGLKPFVGSPGPATVRAREAHLDLWIAPMALALAGLAPLVAPMHSLKLLISAAASHVSGREEIVSLSLWHGFGPALVLGVVALSAGASIYAGRRILRFTRAWSARASFWGPDAFYHASIRGLNALCRAQTRLLQSGYLRYYLLIVIVFSAGLVGYTLLSRSEPFGIRQFSGMRPYEVVLAALILSASFAAIHSRSRLAAVAALGVVGYGIAMVFLLYGAPDLAMTQFAIETLTVILFVLVLYRLPRFSTFSGGKTRIRDMTVALCAGAVISVMILAVTASASTSNLRDFFAKNSWLLAKGRNVVNVILVDFRGLDTLGEITVLAVAAMGVYALLKLR